MGGPCEGVTTALAAARTHPRAHSTVALHPLHCRVRVPRRSRHGGGRGGAPQQWCACGARAPTRGMRSGWAPPKRCCRASVLRVCIFCGVCEWDVSTMREGQGKPGCSVMAVRSVGQETLDSKTRTFLIRQEHEREGAVFQRNGPKKQKDVSEARCSFREFESCEASAKEGRERICAGVRRSLCEVQAHASPTRQTRFESSGRDKEDRER